MGWPKVCILAVHVEVSSRGAIFGVVLTALLFSGPVQSSAGTFCAHEAGGARRCSVRAFRDHSTHLAAAAEPWIRTADGWRLALRFLHSCLTVKPRVCDRAEIVAARCCGACGSTARAARSAFQPRVLVLGIFLVYRPPCCSRAATHRPMRRPRAPSRPPASSSRRRSGAAFPFRACTLRNCLVSRALRPAPGAAVDFSVGDAEVNGDCD
jgi:hypothetical protein